MRLFIIFLFSCQSFLVSAEAAPSDDEVMTLVTASMPVVCLRDRLPAASGAPILLKKVGVEGAVPRWVYRCSVPFDVERSAIRAVIYDFTVGKDAFGGRSVEAVLNVLETGRLIAVEDASDPNRKVRLEMATLLKSGIFPAQVQFQAGAYEDPANNGIGDFCSDLNLLDGTTKTSGGIELTFLPPNQKKRIEGLGCSITMLCDTERSFWCFIALPNGAETLAIDATGIVRVLTGKVAPITKDEAKVAIAAGKIFRR